MTLRWRITLILAAVAFGVGAAASTVSYLSTSSQLRSSIDETLTNRASVIAADNQQNGRDGRGGRGDGGQDEVDCPVAGLFQPAAAAQLVSNDGTVTACIDGGPTLPYDPADLTSPRSTPTLRTVTIDGQQYRLLTVAWSAGGILQIARSLAESDDLLSRLRWQLAALVAAAVVIAAGLGLGSRVPARAADLPPARCDTPHRDDAGPVDPGERRWDR